MRLVGGCLAAACVLLTANGAEPLETIVPLGIGADADAEQVAAALRNAKEKAGLRRFMLHAPGHSVRLSGCYDTEAYRGVGQRVKAIQDLVRADGIDVGYLMGPTMNAGCNLPWPAQIQKDGSACPHRPCPGDPAFQRDFAEHCAAVAAECKPFLYMMEDDYKYFITGCLCEEHLRRFSAICQRCGYRVGQQADDSKDVGLWTREVLLKELAMVENAALRVAWDDFLMEDLYAISRQAEKAIHAVSPETRIGLSVPGALRTDRAAKLARVLAGSKHRPFCRWQGALYGYDKPIQMPETLYVPIWAFANVANGIESYYEADNCPGTAYYGSGAALVGMSSVMLSCGFDGLWYWAIRGGTTFVGTQGENPCLKAYARSAARLAEIRAEGRKGKAVGVCVPCNTAVQLIWPFGATNGRNCDRDGWARYLGLVGLPYTAKSGAAGVRALPPSTFNLQPPTCYSGIWAFEGMSDGEIETILSGNVFLDGEAAEALTARGFAHLIGVTGERRGKIDFTGEQVVATGRLIGSSFHQNYGLDGSTVTRLKVVATSGQHQAEVVSAYYSGKPEKGVQPSVTRFVNVKGGRVVVMALDLAYAKATNLYNDGKRDLIVAMFDWLGGGRGATALPVRTDGDVLVMLTANEDAAKTRLFVHAYNLCGDARDGLSFVVAEPYRGGEVEILDGATWRAADCSWKGDRLTVRAPLHLFDTMVLRVKAVKMPLAFGLEVCWRTDVSAPSADMADSWINAAGGAGVTYIALDAATSVRADVKEAFAAASERGGMKFFPAGAARPMGRSLAATDISSAEALVAAEARAVASGANLLLTAAPEADGNLAASVAVVLAAAKPWSEFNKETLYGTTAGKIDGLPEGVVATQRDGTLFLHVLDGGVKEVVFRPDRAYACAANCVDGMDVPIERLADGRIRLAVPREAGDGFDVVLKLVPKLENPFKRLALHCFAPLPSDVPRFCRLVRERFAADGIDTLFVETGYRYQFESRSECRVPTNCLSRADVRAMAEACRTAGIRLVPTMTVFGHMGRDVAKSGLLRAHPELDESRGRTNLVRNYSHCLCPRHPTALPLVTALAAELVEAFGADEFHMCCDEVFEIGFCPRCQDLPTDVLFADWVNAVLRALKKRGVKTVTMWGDRLIDYRVTCLGDPYESSDNGTHRALGKVDRDIVIGDWRYWVRDAYPSVDLFGEAGHTMWATVWRDSQATERFVRYAKTHDRGHVCGVMLSTWYSFADFADALGGRPFADAALSAKARRDRREVVQVYRALTGARRH